MNKSISLLLCSLSLIFILGVAYGDIDEEVLESLKKAVVRVELTMSRTIDRDGRVFVTTASATGFVVKKKTVKTKVCYLILTVGHTPRPLSSKVMFFNPDSGRTVQAPAVIVAETGDNRQWTRFGSGIIPQERAIARGDFRLLWACAEKDLVGDIEPIEIRPQITDGGMPVILVRYLPDDANGPVVIGPDFDGKILKVVDPINREGQLVHFRVSNHSQPEGASGSPVFDEDGNLLGLCYASFRDQTRCLPTYVSIINWLKTIGWYEYVTDDEKEVERPPVVILGPIEPIIEPPLKKIPPKLK